MFAGKCQKWDKFISSRTDNQSAVQSDCGSMLWGLGYFCGLERAVTAEVFIYLDTSKLFYFKNDLEYKKIAQTISIES